MKTISAIYFVIILALIQFSTACGENHQHEQNAEKKTYTCPMHPQIVQDKPGTCPICGMDLVLFDRSSKDESLTLNEQQQLLANISTMVVGDTSVGAVVRLNGRVVVDPTGSSMVSARIAGRIERLYIRETGIKINRGQPLYRIYSEELAAMQQEYLVAAAQAREFKEDEQFARIEKAARQKLVLLGQSPQQISNLLASNRVQAFTEYNAPVSGVVSGILATEGMYVKEGDGIVKLDSYQNVWVEADVYANEQQLVRQGMNVQVQTGNADAPSTMKVEFISPELVSGTQVTRIRGRLNNAGTQLLPGAQVAVLLPRPAMMGKTLPSSAVIRDGSGAHVWVETSAGKFEPRTVSVTGEEAYSMQIGEGVSNGDKVVVTGAYLLHSEYILKKGKNPSTHQH
jgi:Cu(I)/Ag(I) efflux system membrane fusion protein